jgi:arylsulfatase
MIRLLAAACLLSALLPGGARAAQEAPRPNIVLILADDLGFSDLGCYGGEIRTPNLDALAANGLRFARFYNSARCCPSRASLMTGLYPHQAGIGGMVNAKPGAARGYRGQLHRPECVTVAEVLRDAGYFTAISGKWHLGPEPPTEWGFDEAYSLGGLHHSHSQWDPKAYVRHPEGRTPRRYTIGAFYATDAFTDHAIDFMSAARQAKKPFFLHLAYTAPHFPLHAPKDMIDAYVPVYEKGWDETRQARLDRMKKLGIVPESWALPPRSPVGQNPVARQTGWADKGNPAWLEVPADRRADLVRRMAIYAAMVERMDRGIGRVVEDLRAAGELERTFILFLSDNGACAEWTPWGFDVRSGPENVLHAGDGLAKMGQPGTYHSLGSGWANACNTPLTLYKHYAHEGGISTPCVVHWPQGLQRKGEWVLDAGHLVDVLPTCLRLAGAAYPKERGEVRPLPTEGLSLLPALQGQPMPPRALFFEHEGNRAVIEGDWKLVSAAFRGNAWELYNLADDRVETRDLAATNADRASQMSARYAKWADRCFVTRKPAK